MGGYFGAEYGQLNVALWLRLLCTSAKTHESNMLEANNVELLQDWDISTELIWMFALKGGGRLKIPGALGDAFLGGQTSTRRLRAENGSIVVSLGGSAVEEN